MMHLGLIGYPVEHSLSPILQAAALRSCKLDGDYSLFPVRPTDMQGLKGLLARMRVGDIRGLNVTIPHKQNVIPLLDELTPTARAIGAVNTICLSKHKLVGDNTDAPGFLKDLNHFMVARRSEIRKQKSAIVLGAGGSARAVVHALLTEGWILTLYARKLEQAQQLATSFAGLGSSITDTLSNIELSNISLIVNTTPLGMAPNTDQSAWPADLPFPTNAVIYDLVYNPRETKLVKNARAAGLSATTGLGMLIEQAVLAFELWTGKNASREIMLSAVEDV